MRDFLSFCSIFRRQNARNKSCYSLMVAIEIHQDLFDLFAESIPLFVPHFWQGIDKIEHSLQRVRFANRHGHKHFFKIFEIQILLEKYISNTKYKYFLCKVFEIPVKVFESSNTNTLEKDFKYKYFLSRVFQIQILITKKYLKYAFEILVQFQNAAQVCLLKIANWLVNINLLLS